MARYIKALGEAAAGLLMAGCASFSSGESEFRVPYDTPMKVANVKITENVAMSRDNFTRYDLEIEAVDGKGRSYRIDRPLVGSLEDAKRESSVVYSSMIKLRKPIPGQGVIIGTPYEVYNKPAVELTEENGEKVIEVWRPSALEIVDRADMKSVSEARK